MRAIWLSIVASAALYCWAPEAAAKPPPIQDYDAAVPAQTDADAEGQDSAAADDGGAQALIASDASDASDGGGQAAADSGGGDGGVASASSGGGGCDVIGRRPEPAAAFAGLAFAGLIVLRRRGRAVGRREAK